MRRDIDFTNKRVTVIGLSESGFSAAKLLRRVKAKVRISELRDEGDIRAKLELLGGVDFEVGAHTRRFIESSELIVVSPGVASDAEVMRWTAELRIPVIGELELGYMFCAAPIIAVTGTNGKSTTASLLHEMLKANAIKSCLLGNIGRPVCEDILEVPSDAVLVLEVSSFQLETIKRFRPHIAILLNLTRNHLDRYRNMDEYTKAKLRIFGNQEGSDYAILNYDNPEMRRLSESISPKVFYFSLDQKVKGSYLEEDRLFVDLGDGPCEVCRKGEISFSLAHNLDNVLASALALKLIRYNADIASSVRNFIGLRHRFEFVAEIEGVEFVDDSKSTTVDSTLRALSYFPDKRVTLIAGGKDKGSDYSPLADQVKKLNHLILIGEARKKIKDVVSGFALPITEAVSMQEAVSLSRRIAKEGDTVLLSPMCSSFDMFKDYKERGEAFREAVFDTLIASSI